MPQSSSGSFILANSTRPAAAGAAVTGPADPAAAMSVSLRLRRNPDAPPLPAPGAKASLPVRGRGFLSREDFANIHGTIAADFAVIRAFAAAQGLSVVSTESGRRTAVLSGTAAQLGAAFGVTLQQFHTGKAGYIGHAGAITLPNALAGIVQSVHGLDTRQLVEPLVRLPLDIAPGGPLGTGGTTPAQVAKLYNFPTNSAAGETVGILEFGGGFQSSDISSFFHNANLPVPAISVVSVDGRTNSYSGINNVDAEVALDIEVVGSVAVGAKIAVYFAPWGEQGIIDCVTTAIHDTTNKPSVLSISWGGPESGWGSSIMAIADAFAEADAMGITVFIASGDSGAGNPVDVMYPGSDPSVTSCGGTTISNVSGNSFTQTAWAGSGGGVSGVFGAQSYQSWAGVPASKNPAGHIGRGVPDIAGNADPNSGYTLFLNGGNYGLVGGTSAVAPLYAGLVAQLNAAYGAKIGFFNNNLYACEGPYAFEDITVGNNGAYSCRLGWDPVTGLGSINGAALEIALLGVGLAPALADFNGQLYMAWKGIEFDEGIYYTRYNGANFAPQTKVSNYGTSAGVSLAVFNNHLFMAWKGEGNDQRIWYSSYDGNSWAPQQAIANVATSTGPRLAVFGGKLYMAWKGMEDDQRLWFSSFNGSAWAPQQMIAGVASSVGPALAVYNNTLYAAWKGEFGDPGLYFATFNGAGWSAQKQIANTGTSEGPSLSVYNNQLFAVWKGEYGDQRLWYAAFNGSAWTPQKQIPGVYSSVGPGIAAFNNSLFAAWKGMNGDERIWYSAYNGAGWTNQQIVPNVGTSPDLIAAE